MAKGGVFMLRTLMRRAVRALWVITILIIVGIIPWMIASMSANGYSPHSIAQTIAGVFALAACLLSIWLMAMHLDNLTDPKLQYPILRILMMVPIYALNGWIALTFKESAIYVDTFRKIYEAFVLNQFFTYLVTYLGDDAEIAAKLKLRANERGGQPMHHIFPCCLLQDWDESRFVDGCRTGVNLYVLFRVVTGLIELALTPFGLYHTGHLNADSPYLYITILNNFVACWAIYCLILFYLALERELRPVNTLGKLLCVKAVVFFSWWQSVILVLVEDAGLLERGRFFSESYDSGEVAVVIQDFCICIEMLFVAIAHAWVFSYKEFRKLHGQEDDESDIFARVVSMFDFRDIGQDVMHSMQNPEAPQVDRQTLAPLLGSSPRLDPEDPEGEPLSEEPGEGEHKLPVIEEAEHEGTASPPDSPKIEDEEKQEEQGKSSKSENSTSGSASAKDEGVPDKS